MAKYRAATTVFIAPILIKEGTVFNYDGPYGTAFLPLDEEAHEKADAFFKEKPHAALNPVDQLRIVGGQPGEIQNVPQAEILEEPAKLDDTLNVGSLANPGKALPGPTEAGGKAVAQEAKAAAADKK